MFDSMPVVLWSLEGALLRREDSRTVVVEAVHGWMGNPLPAASPAASESAAWRHQMDNEIVREVLQQAGIEPAEWMIRGALGYHERCLRERLQHLPCLAVPGIERALASIARCGAVQAILSWQTERSTSARLLSAHLSDAFDEGMGRLRGVYCAEHGDLDGLLEAFKNWAGLAPVVLISGSPREIMMALRWGIYGVGVTSGGSNPLELSAAGASLVVTERTGLEHIDHSLTLDRLVAGTTGSADKPITTTS